MKGLKSLGRSPETRPQGCGCTPERLSPSDITGNKRFSKSSFIFQGHGCFNQTFEFVNENIRQDLILLRFCKRIWSVLIFLIATSLKKKNNQSLRGKSIPAQKRHLVKPDGPHLGRQKKNPATLHATRMNNSIAPLVTHQKECHSHILSHDSTLDDCVTRKICLNPVGDLLEESQSEASRLRQRVEELVRDNEALKSTSFATSLCAGGPVQTETQSRSPPPHLCGCYAAFIHVICVLVSLLSLLSGKPCLYPTAEQEEEQASCVGKTLQPEKPNVSRE